MMTEQESVMNLVHSTDDWARLGAVSDNCNPATFRSYEPGYIRRLLRTDQLAAVSNLCTKSWS
jgi:hypothetical protein